MWFAVIPHRNAFKRNDIRDKSSIRSPRVSVLLQPREAHLDDPWKVRYNMVQRAGEHQLG